MIDQKLSPEWKKQLLRLPWLLLIPLGFLLPSIAAGNPALVERVYSQGIYPVVAAVLGFVSALAPTVSLAELVLYGLLIAIPTLLVLRLVQLFHRRIPPVRFVGFLLSLGIFAGAMLSGFYLLWGFHYFRPTLGTLLSLDVRERPVEELEALTKELALAANALRAQVPEEDGLFAPDLEACFARIPEAYRALGEEIPLFSRRVRSPKPVLASEAMSWAGISGIFIPYTGEANVNIHQNPLLLPSSAAHEAAHAIGIARENEANFAGYLAAMAGNDRELQYSAVMLALVHCGNQLYAAEADAYRAIYESYSEGVRRDLSAHNAYWDAYEGPVEETVTEVNDSYLKHNHLESGVKSYGEMVDLLLAWHEDQPLDLVTLA